MHERDCGIHLHSRGKLPSGDRARHGQRPLGGVDHRPQSQGLFDDRVEVGVVVSSFKFLAHAGQHGRIAQQELKREGETGGRCLVPGAEHREQLVAQLRVGHRLAVLVASTQQQREHVSALLQIRLVAASLDFLIQQGVRRAQAPHESTAGTQSPEVGTRSGREHEDRAAVDDSDQPLSQPLHPLGLRDAEHRSTDHLERDRAHTLAQHQVRAGAPAGDLALGHVADHLAERGHP